MGNVTTPDDSKITTLLGGIAADAQKLVEQEWTMAKAEVVKEYTKAKDAAVYFAVAGGTALLASIMLLLAVANWISWAFPECPLWASYGIIALVLGTLGGGLYFAARSKSDSVKLAPERTIETVKETLTWNQT